MPSAREREVAWRERGEREEEGHHERVSAREQSDSREKVTLPLLIIAHLFLLNHLRPFWVNACSQGRVSVDQIQRLRSLSERELP